MQISFTDTLCFKISLLEINRRIEFVKYFVFKLWINKQQWLIKIALYRN